MMRSVLRVQAQSLTFMREVARHSETPTEVSSVPMLHHGRSKDPFFCARFFWEGSSRLPASCPMRRSRTPRCASSEIWSSSFPFANGLHQQILEHAANRVGMFHASGWPSPGTRDDRDPMLNDPGLLRQMREQSPAVAASSVCCVKPSSVLSTSPSPAFSDDIVRPDAQTSLIQKRSLRPNSHGEHSTAPTQLEILPSLMRSATERMLASKFGIAFVSLLFYESL